MSDHDDPTRGAGERIAVARKAHGMTQRELASRVSVSLSLLRKVEQGSRDATPGVVAAVARALDVSVSTLTGQPYDQHGRHRDRVHQHIPALRRALTYWDLPPDLTTAPRGVAELATATAEVARMRRDARHLALLEVLPALMMETTAAAQDGSPETRERLFGLLSIQLFAAHSVTHKTGYEDLSAVVEDRFTWASDHSGDELLRAVAAWARTTTMLAVGSYDIGLRLLDRAQNRIAGVVAGRGDGGRGGGLRISGPLHLRSAMLAARAGDADSARSHLAEAARLVRATGDADQDGGYHQLSFGPTNLAIHEVAAAVELGDGGAAVARASELSIQATPGLPRVRIGHHYVDLSRAQLWIGDREGALVSLHTARTLAPEQTRHHPTTREVVRMLVQAHQRSNERLARFAGWVGGEF